MYILEKQVREQVLLDGGHFELSPMYHALAIEDILDLINICSANSAKLSTNQKEQYDYWLRIVASMMAWLAVVSHPDGKISFFNDAAFNIAPDNSELNAYAQRLGFQIYKPKSGITDLSQSGLFRFQDEHFVLIADLAQIGPSYLPGHAHADTLSFELSVCNQRIFVTSGTSEYGLGAERLRQRYCCS